METQELKCQVPLPGNPDRVMYVPLQPNQKSTLTGFSTGGIVGLVVGALVVVALVGFMLIRYTKKEPVDVKNDFS